MNNRRLITLFAGSAAGILIVAGVLFALHKLPMNSVLNSSGYQESLGSAQSVSNYAAVQKKYGLTLTGAQEQFLNTNKFLLVDASQTSLRPSKNFNQMLTDFDNLGGLPAITSRTPDDTKLVTPDIILEAYHSYFELTLEQLEQHELNQSLGDFLTSLHTNLAAAVASSSGTAKTHYQTLEAQIVLARVLFETKNAPKPASFDKAEEETAYNDADVKADSATNAKETFKKYSADLPSALAANVQTEIDRIYAASAITPSTLFGQYDEDVKTDYTQFTPRSHYTKNSTLRAYFRAMIYLGRSSYQLRSDAGITDAALLAKQFAVKSSTGVTPLDPWQKIMDVTSFYAGQSDDLSYPEWQEYVSTTAGKNSSDSTLVDAATTKKLADQLLSLKQPKILSDVVVNENIASMTKADLLRKALGFRIFGQRFTLDAWVLNDLTAGQEKSEPKLPSTPSALFVPAVMGDPLAKQFSDQFLTSDAKFTPAEVTDFDTKLAQKQADLQKVTKDEWLASMSSSWLYVLGSLTHSYGTDHPQYMRSNPYLAKQIQTFLGSYTELKHDTLLYAKQSYAEKGGGPGDAKIPPVVKGFVEPNMDFWNRVTELLDRTKTIFDQHHLFTGDTANASSRLNEFRTQVDFYKTIAQKELAGSQISDDDYEKLRTSTLSFMAEPFDNEDPNDDSGKTALVADIHTDASAGQILYEATAEPYLMLTVVGNERSPRVVAGLAYNHYEFTNPIGGPRLTDEDWRKKVYDNPSTLPAKNFWYQSLQAK